MRELTPADPRRIGGYLLLRRLGEGRSGVVYLARSLGGEPVALKVIRPAYASDPAFRARFEADVATARHVRARRLVTVAAADTAGGTVWAAYPYVAGPTLTEAVAAHGPLPPRTVGALGALLAESLNAVHQGGLTHRDLRPGHVQLTLDGPRLTGFGGSGTRIGPPGYLSPEQAVGGPDSLGPPSDVFALGCLLTLAATGRGPFGDGTPRELLRRAAYEPADLADVPRGLLEVVQACLHKDPHPRPSAADLCRELAAPVGAGWLPGRLAREVAARYAAPLPRPASHEPFAACEAPDNGFPRLPIAPSDERVPAEQLPDGAGELGASAVGVSGLSDPAPPPAGDAGQGRRRTLRLLGGAGALAAFGWGAGLLIRNQTAPETRPAAHTVTYTIGLHADLSGEHASFGNGQQRGLNMAIDELNRMGNLPFALAVRTLDDAGDRELAAGVARQLADDPQVMAVIGPTHEEVLPAVAEIYGEAELPLLALSVSDLVDRETCPTLLHARPSTALAGLAVGDFLSGRAAARVAVLDDLSAGEYSGQTTRVVNGTMDRERFEVYPRELHAEQTDFTALATELLADGVDAVVWCGFAEGAGQLARALRDAGFDGLGLATERAIGPQYFRHTGQPPDDWFFLATYTDPRRDPRARDFGRAHRERFGWDPDPYAAEGYDAARMLVGAMRGTVERNDTLGRTELFARLRASQYRGVARDLAFDSVGDYAGGGPLAYLYQAHLGELRFQGALSH
ncbi:bifunctional serine/threonine-protein kinase/ABC transporter substrate-binding protein [Streptomyces profundus]|uniref:bifunctional serine/threonine-protein kinase/ABC transporter substrate-binding protein n=1 Tax=Streptomyces profundus TaxID=2867410 RepID=UPI001D169711|nr:bifunctional serine/threonine-protein kinase/ABC transporter substrate-binding protein [Streptomyces sp. MA3_2.13]UED87633.1 ABC transporter substrate-binding protein [Streptomyces sp. MA3_2.13]